MENRNKKCIVILVTESYHNNDIVKEIKQNYNVKDIVVLDEPKKVSEYKPDIQNQFFIIAGNQWDRVGEMMEERLDISLWNDYIPWWITSCMDKDSNVYFDKLCRISEKEGKLLETYMRCLSKSRKLLTVYGNCQSAAIREKLSHADVLSECFLFLVIAGVHQMKSLNYNMDKLHQCLHFMDLFIYQYIREDNRFGAEFASDQMIQSLSPECKKVCIPNIYFAGYFPGYKRGNIVFFDKERKYSIEQTDGIMDDVIESGKNESDIISMLKADNLIGKKELEKHVRNSLLELQKREVVCDVKISDYIEANYQTEYLFYTPNHPTEIVIKELTQRILMFLGYESFHILPGALKEVNHIELFIYPAVKKHLNLIFSKGKFRMLKYYDLNYLDLMNYYNQYKSIFYENINCIFRSGNMKKVIVFHTDLVSERGSCVLEFADGMLHLALYLNIHFKEKINETIFRLPQLFAPISAYVLPVVMIGGTSGLCVINENGEAKMNADGLNGKVKACAIDTCYASKITQIQIEK